MNPAIARRRHAKAATAHNGGDHSHTHQHGGHEINVGQKERQFSLIGGGILAAYGLLRGSISGLALAAVGGALAWRGYSGHCEVYHLLGHSTADSESGQELSQRTRQNAGRGQSVTADVPL
jgi:uncharacterized membrane protein